MKLKQTGLIFLFSSFLLSAHESSVPLSQREQKVSLFLAPHIGALVSSYFVEDLEGNLTLMRASFTSLCYDFSYGGMPLTYEYGFTDSFSAGINISLIDMFMHRALNTENWTLYAAPYLRYSLPESKKNDPDFNFHFVSKCSFSPLFAYPEFYSAFLGDGMINWYNTASFSYAVINFSDTKVLHVYLDIKNITTFINESFNFKGYTKEAFSFSWLTKEEYDDIEFERATGSVLLLNPGLEMELNHVNFHLGYYFPVLDYTKYRVRFNLYNIFSADLGRVELNWSMRF